ncbi:hypothetical protein ACHAXT_011282 [Thalassiosira profunda]
MNGITGAIDGRRRRRRLPAEMAATGSAGAAASRNVAPLLAATSTFVFFVAAALLVAGCAEAFSVPPTSNNNLPPFPHPVTAEEVVQNQLHCYQTSDLRGAYALCSPSNQNATGSVDDYTQQLKAAPYDLIVGHARAEVLLEIKPEGIPNEESGIVDVACCLVRIRPGIGARREFPVWFWWEVTKLTEEVAREGVTEGSIDAISGQSPKGGGGRWMVDCIVPDFDDLDFETESLSIENFMEEGDDGDDDELTIYWDMGE